MERSVWWAILIGSSVGGFIPSVWGDSFLSPTSILFSAAGALIAIYLNYKLTL